MPTIWEEIENDCLRLLSLPHNVVELRKEGETPESRARKTVADVKSGLGGVPPRRQEFRGPKLFLRVVGPANRAYSGAWWFDADLLSGVEAAFSRVYFQSADKKRAIRDMLRELLAVSAEWNAMTEVWALAVPPGEKISGYVGKGAPQKLFADLPLPAKGNRMLVGQAEQVFFPVKNPLWVKQYSNLNA
ncbi:MAG: hypothetical protein M3282_12400 [Gemmatimonadota bacterium]|jgi:hypothetical protein|nr:hypothetical protein [Gemmatimonadota bacterium]